MDSDSSHTEKQEYSAGKFFHNKYIIGAFVAVGIFFLLGTATIAFAQTYQKDRIFYGVSLGDLDLGGMQKDEAMRILTSWHEDWWSNELRYHVLDEQNKEITSVQFYPIIVYEEAGQSVEIIRFDLNKMLEQAYQYGRSQSLAARLGNQLLLLFRPVKIQASVTVDQDQLENLLRLELKDYETIPVNAGFELKDSTTPVLISEAQGNTFDYQTAVRSTVTLAEQMRSADLSIRRRVTKPEIYTEDVKTALSHLSAVQKLFPLTMTYYDEKIDFSREWNVSWEEAVPLLGVAMDQEGRSQIGLITDKGDGEEFFSQFELLVNSTFQDAKFSIGENGKVEQFQPSQKGYEVDREETLANINQWISEQLLSADLADEDDTQDMVQLAVKMIEPKVPTGEVNDLGITEVLGVGYSNFSGSPRNRIHNIGIGADKLNGLLIEPDEEFSLLDALRPFTFSGGYLPELVIKGDKIEPEIGGGLCQIGSTTFRAAMKSGLPITERRNHSLVVSYYNDPRNGNPGTDATIYDSSPDFKFHNDTGNYILIETNMDIQTGDLYFTFWGTSDGREADYSEPVVHRWIGAGPTKIIETEDLEPGEKKCQGAHPGAEASFTYTVTKPNGETEEQEFFSSYRPLPTICLVGIDPNAPKADPDVNSDTQSESSSEVSEESPPGSSNETSDASSSENTVDETV